MSAPAQEGFAVVVEDVVAGPLETPRIGLWLDTSDPTPAQTVDTILAQPDRSLVPA